MAGCRRIEEQQGGATLGAHEQTDGAAPNKGSINLRNRIERGGRAFRHGNQQIACPIQEHSIDARLNGRNKAALSFGYREAEVAKELKDEGRQSNLFSGPYDRYGN